MADLSYFRIDTEDNFPTTNRARLLYFEVPLRCS